MAVRRFQSAEVFLVLFVTAAVFFHEQSMGPLQRMIFDDRYGAIDPHVEQRLRQMGITPSKIKKKPIEIRLPSFGGVPRKSLIIFTRQLATMIDAGLPLVQCLEGPGRNQAQGRVGLDIRRCVARSPQGL